MKRTLLLLMALLTWVGGAWAIDTKVADYSNVQPWGTGAYISRSTDKLTLTSTDVSGFAGLSLTTNGSSSAGYWDRSDNWLLIIPGSTDEVAYTVTITAPTGYTIVGYNMECCSWNANRTYVVTAADGTTVTTTSTAIQTLNVKNLDASSTTFTVKGESTSSANVYFTIKNMTVALVKKQGTQLNSIADGVTWSAGATSWNNSWSSGTTPNVTLNANWSTGETMNEFKAATNVTGAFYLHTTNTPVYTISVPFNYLIKSYTIVGTANAAVTLTPTTGTADNTTFAANMTKAATVAVTPTNSVKFTLTGSSTTYIDNATIYVEYVTTSSQSITNLDDLSNDKAYVITNARATWQFADNATAMTATNSTTNLGATAQQIAIVKEDSKYYLYSVNARKYLTANNTLTASPSERQPVTITSTGDSNYPWLFQFTDNTNGYINIGSDINVAINNWNSTDDGNKNAIIEAADFDTESLPFDVTYTLKYGDATVGTATVGAYKNDAASLPSSLDNGLCDYTYSVETLTGTTDVTAIATWKESAPFQISDEANDDAHWYYMNLDVNNTLVPTYNAEGEYNVEMSTSARVLENTNQEWAFVGNPYTGLSIYNRAAGSSMTLGTSANPADDGNTGGSTRAVLLASPTYGTWIPQASTHGTNGFYLFLKIDESTKYGANNRDSQFSFWTTGYGSGSTFTVEEVLDNYYSLVEAEVIPFLMDGEGHTSETIGKPFGLSSTAASNIIQTYLTQLNNGQFSKSEYEAIVAAKDAGILYPEAGKYYLVKNNFNGKYLRVAAGETRGQVFADLTAEEAAKDASAHLYVMEADSKPYLMSQGQYFNWVYNNLNGYEAYTVSAKDKYVHFANPAPGVGAFSIAYGNGDGEYASYLGIGFYALKSNSSDVVAGSTTDATSELAQWTFEEVSTLNITLNGPVDGSYYATLCVPFDITLEGATAYTLTKDGTNLNMSAGEASVSAGTPVLLIGAANAATATIGSTYSSTISTATALTGQYFASSFDGATNYTLGTDGTKVGFFHWDGTTLAANRAYVAGESSEVKGFYLSFGLADGINQLSAEPAQKEVFDLSGRRVSNPVRGLYIINGKKMAVK